MLTSSAAGTRNVAHGTAHCATGACSFRQRVQPLLKPRTVETSVSKSVEASKQQLASLARISHRPCTPSSASSSQVDPVTSSGEWDGFTDVPLGPGHEPVSLVLRGTGKVKSCLPTDSLAKVVPLLNSVTGVPVRGSSGKVVGIISRKDIVRVRKASGNMQDPVSKHMRPVTVTVPSSATIQETADIMIKHKIYRLPVVDDKGVPLGIVARSDIFKPLMQDDFDDFMMDELDGVQGKGPYAVKAQLQKKKVTWNYKYLYDGNCSMCQNLKKMLERQDKGRGRIKFVNIAEPSYNPASHMGIAFEDAMETIHAIKPDGTVLRGTEALKAMLNEVGLGWAAKLGNLPGLNKLVDASYDFMSANRIRLGGTFDAIAAAKRMGMSEQGVDTCADVDEECEVEW